MRTEYDISQVNNLDHPKRALLGEILDFLDASKTGEVASILPQLEHFMGLYGVSLGTVCIEYDGVVEWRVIIDGGYGPHSAETSAGANINLAKEMAHFIEEHEFASNTNTLQLATST